jgi:hypothetical protein
MHPMDRSITLENISWVSIQKKNTPLSNSKKWLSRIREENVTPL